jgi:hypothetical protein
MHRGYCFCNHLESPLACTFAEGGRAASYPIEIVDAASWSKASPALKGDAAVTAVKDQTWDVSSARADGETGVSTFMVSQSGDVYEKDLGPDTEKEAAAITLFNPDKTWDKADMTPPP